MSKNLQKSEKLKKKKLQIFFFLNPIILIFQHEDYAIWPKLSSPTRFRIQGGWSERYGEEEKEVRTNERKSLCLILDATNTLQQNIMSCNILYCSLLQIWLKHNKYDDVTNPTVRMTNATGAILSTLH